MTFAMAIARRPASLKNANQKYKEAIRQAAQARMGQSPPLQGSLYVRIVWFHAVKTTQDVDNIVKPILDALKGVVFADDFQVAQCLAVRIDTNKTYSTSGDAPSGIFEALLSLLSGSDNVLYVEVGAQAGQQVAFGPIEGGIV
ncbi:MAG: RusA family crossover junction endodeoxyribonuclease [Armatimonadota bacterium]|nr:RusA family crossover junction endodeoxyribonuclease [Armatimonadota bacterium]